MQLPTSIAKLRRPRGLAARAAMFATMLIVATAFLSAGILVWGAARAGAREQAAYTEQNAQRVATVAGEIIARGDVDQLGEWAALARRDASVRGISVRNTANAVLAEAAVS